MRQVIKRPPGKIRPAPEPRSSSVRVRRAWSATKRAIVGPYRRYAMHRASKPNVDRPGKWVRRRSWFIIPAACIGGLIAIAWGLWSLYVIAFVHHKTFIESYCNKVSACDAATGFVGPVLTVALATAVFFMWRAWRLKRPIVRKAREDPRGLVPTAGTIVGRIVGRTELCLVIMRAIRNRDYRRPYLLVGGVGVGKTAVLVQLTKMLAEYRAVPVPVRLRDVETELNFGEAAREQFCKEVDSGTLPEGQSDKVWRQLRRDDKIVVLADGLEEAFPEGNDNEKDRDNLIRRAIQQAEEQKLPLVIASRPHHPLEATAAAILELEPLSEEAALDYVERNIPVQDARRLDWIVETASVADAPLYLQITRQLYRKGLLEHVTKNKDRKPLDTRAVDRSALRWRLLDAWGAALADGHLRPEVPLSPKDRNDTINVASALACVGLLKDTLEVRFDDLISQVSNDAYEAPGARAEPGQDPPVSVYQAIWDRVRRENWQDLYSSEIENKKPASPERYFWLVSLAATRADQLGIVEAYGNRVRFPHSILQAYLGCRFLDSLLQDPGDHQTLGKVLEEPGPARELLIAFCLYSRAGLCQCASKTNGQYKQTGATEPPPPISPPPVTAEVVLPTAAEVPAPVVAEAAVPAIETAPATPAVAEAAAPTSEKAPVASATAAVAVPTEGALVMPGTNATLTPRCETCRSMTALTETLREAAEEHTDAKAFDIYAAALEIDSIQEVPLQGTIAKSLSRRWQKILTGDRRTLEEAKLGLVLRFGEALREVAQQEPGRPAYGEFFRIGCLEESYPVRLAIAQEIGSGGDKAFTALCCDLPDPLKTYRERLKKPLDGAPNGRGDRDAPATVTATGGERDEPHGAEDAAREDMTRRRSREETNRARAKIWREFVLRAWITPLLVGSVSDTCHDEAQRHLEAWLKHLQPHNSQHGRAELPLSLEIALAQGFKAAANQRKRNPYTSDKSRVYLVRQAEEMLKYARYWFTHLTLIHALCLWTLPDDTDTSMTSRTAGNDGNMGGKELANKNHAYPRRRGTRPTATVARWLSMAGSKCAPADRYAADKSGKGQLEHPFVAEAGDLAALALESGIPGRFIWIDESGIVGKVGSRPASPSDYRKHNLWIPPSSGWSALDRRAQQLVADVLIMLNLTEQAGTAESPDAREHRLENANRSTLPPCLTRDRRPLQPGRTIGSAIMASHGSTCLDDCQFELCPYPPSGAQPRAELSEAFCRRQQSLLAHRLRRPGRKTAPWQGLTPKELETFWAQMGWRSRPPRPEE
jgi:NACHT domain-containing protein